jgi:hypothetical protein
MSSTRTYTSGKPIETIAAAITLEDADSGKTFLLSAAAGAAVTLPAPKSGMAFKFVVGSAFATTNWTIVTNGSSNIIDGNVIVAGAHVPAASEDTVSFVATAESVGDYVELISDGTRFYLSGSGVSSGAITATQAS